MENVERGNMWKHKNCRKTPKHTKCGKSADPTEQPKHPEQLGIGVEIVRNLIQKGDIPVIRWGYRTLRIDSSKLDEVIADLTIGGSNR